MDYLIRDMRNEEFGLLEDFLFEAIFVPEGFEREIARNIIYDDAKCRATFAGFGELPDDRAVIAEADGYDETNDSWCTRNNQPTSYLPPSGRSEALR